MEPLKVDFGGVGHYLNGVVTVNIDPDSGADIICDISWKGTLHKYFQIASIDQISCFHTLEHLQPDDIFASIIYWRFLLKPGGRLLIAVPDTSAIFEDVACETISEETAIAILFRRTPFDYQPRGMQHYWAWTEETLKRDLRNAGYVNVKTFGPEIYPDKWMFDTPGMDFNKDFGKYHFPNLRVMGYKENTDDKAE